LKDSFSGIPMMAAFCGGLRRVNFRTGVRTRTHVVTDRRNSGLHSRIVGYYNWRVTGSPLVLPHFIEQRMYFTTPVFLWQHETPSRAYANPQSTIFMHNFMPSLYQTGWDSRGQFWWEVHGVFGSFFWGPLFRSVSSDSLGCSVIATFACCSSIRAFRDRSVDRRVFTMRTMPRRCATLYVC